MKKKIILLMCILTVVGCGCKSKKKEINKEKLDFKVNFNVAKEKKIDGLAISDIQLVIDNNGVSYYKANVTNTTDTIYTLKQINIRILGKNRKEITKFTAYIGSNLTPGETRNIEVTMDQDLTSGYEVEYEIKR